MTGWITMGSLQSAVMGFGTFAAVERLFGRDLSFSVAENVIVQVRRCRQSWKPSPDVTRRPAVRDRVGGTPGRVALDPA